MSHDGHDEVYIDVPGRERRDGLYSHVNSAHPETQVFVRPWSRYMGRYTNQPSSYARAFITRKDGTPL